MIIGLTGRNGAGKGLVADYLKDKGYRFHSLSDVLREELRAEDREITRENLIQKGRQVRKAHGEGYLAKQILSRIQSDQNAVVDSFRHPQEVEVLRSAQEFHLICVDADAEIRYRRIHERSRPGDPTSFEEFLVLEKRESESVQSEGQQLSPTASMADTVLLNNGTPEELYANLGKLLSRLMHQMQRPDWDEYFMKLAKVAALRSNCIKRKVAAIIVRDRRVISTGYNGTPRGTRNCFEGGCPRCNSLADSGTKLDECLCSHGEENAITQAAYHGVSVKDSSLYTTFAPCLMCTKMIINAGIQEVIYNEDYPLNATSFALLHEAGVQCRRFQVD